MIIQLLSTVSVETINFTTSESIKKELRIKKRCNSYQMLKCRKSKVANGFG